MLTDPFLLGRTDAVVVVIVIVIGTPFPIRNRLTTQHIQAIRYNV